MTTKTKTPIYQHYDFNSSDEYFNYIIDSEINGQRQQVRQLINQMEPALIRDFLKCHSYSHQKDVAACKDIALEILTDKTTHETNAAKQENSRIKTIDIDAKQWFDKVNGNSYFSAQVTINLGLKDQRTIYLPFQYGYDDHYRYMAFKALIDAGEIPQQPENWVPWRYYDEHKIIARHKKETGCKKREVVAWGASR